MMVSPSHPYFSVLEEAKVNVPGVTAPQLAKGDLSNVNNNNMAATSAVISDLVKTNLKYQDPAAICKENSEEAMKPSLKFDNHSLDLSMHSRSNTVSNNCGGIGIGNNPDGSAMAIQSPRRKLSNLPVGCQSLKAENELAYETAGVHICSSLTSMSQSIAANALANSLNATFPDLLTRYVFKTIPKILNKNINNLSAIW